MQRVAGNHVERERIAFATRERDPGIVLAEAEPGHGAGRGQQQFARVAGSDVDEPSVTVVVAERDAAPVVAFLPRGNALVAQRSDTVWRLRRPRLDAQA